MKIGLNSAEKESVLSKDPLLLLLLWSDPFSAGEGGTGTRSGPSGQSKPAGPEGEAASHTEAVPICVFRPYAHGRPHTTHLYQHVPETRWPIVYSPRYNITFMGLEKLHPFDAGKWGKVISFLKGMKGLTLDPTSASPNLFPHCLSLT